MIIDGLHEKNILDGDFPFRMVVNTDIKFDYPSHWHNALEIVYALENRFDVVVNNTRYHLEEQDILFIPGGDIHGFHDQQNSGKRIFIQFDITDIGSCRDIQLIRPVLQHVIKISPTDSFELHHSMVHVIREIEKECSQKNFAYQLSLMALSINLLVLLSRNMTNGINLTNPESGFKKISGLSKINKAFSYIEDNFQEEIDLKDVASATGFSEFHFSRMFKEITGNNFHQYLNEFRIRKAQRYLMDTDTTIIQAAYAAGFSSIATFNRLFKEIMGCTPGSYKKKYSS